MHNNSVRFLFLHPAHGLDQLNNNYCYSFVHLGTLLVLFHLKLFNISPTIVYCKTYY